MEEDVGGRDRRKKEWKRGYQLVWKRGVLH